MKKLVLLICGVFAMSALHGRDTRNDTYCNPLNIDYTYMMDLGLRRLGVVS